jgi:hypothetical protein
MSTTTIMVSLLVVLGLLALFVVVRRSTQPKPGPAQQDTGLNDFPHLRAIKQAPDAVMELAAGVHLYCRGDHCLTIAEHEHPVAHDFTFQGALWSRKAIIPGTWSFLRSVETFVDLTE